MSSTDTDGDRAPFADEYTEVESEEHATELLSELEPDETMLEIDESDHLRIDHGRSYIRAFDGHDDEYQIRVWFGGAPIWESTADLSKWLVGANVAVVDYRRMTEV